MDPDRHWILQQPADGKWFFGELARFNITSEQLLDEKQELERLLQLRMQALVEKGQAQEATRQRNKKLEEMEDY